MESKEKARERSRRYFQAHKAERAAYSRGYYRRVGSKNPSYRLRWYKRGAARRHLAWAIPDALAIDLFTDRCYYCGADPIPINGIDRVNNARGYEEDNVVTACTLCQRAKSDHPVETFQSWVMRVASHMEQYA